MLDHDDDRPPSARLAGRGAALAVAAALEDLAQGGATDRELWAACLRWLLARGHGRADRAELAAALRTIADGLRREAFTRRGDSAVTLASAQGALRAAARDLGALHRSETSALAARGRILAY